MCTLPQILQSVKLVYYWYNAEVSQVVLHGQQVGSEIELAVLEAHFFSNIVSVKLNCPSR